MAELKAEYGGQTSKDEDDEIDQMISDATRLIESVYRDINHFSARGGGATPTRAQQEQAQQPCTPPRRSTRSNSSAPASPKTPRQHVLTPSSREIELEVERINRFVETVDHNLRTIVPANRRRSSQSSGASSRGSRLNSPNFVQIVEDVTSTTPEEARGAVIEPMSTPPQNARRRNRVINVNVTPEAIIDLSETQSPSLASGYSNAPNDDDDVIIVSSNLNDVVDLCMSLPALSNIHQNATSTPSANNNIISSSSSSSSRRMPAVMPQQRSAFRAGNSCEASDAGSSRGFRSRSPQRTARAVEVQTSTTTMLQQHNSCAALTQRAEMASAGRSKVAAAPSSQRTIGGVGAGGSSGAGGGGAVERTPFMCPVCMDSTIKNQPTSTKCGHVFCGPCIREAIRLSHKCPMCNTKLKPNMLFRIYL